MDQSIPAGRVPRGALPVVRPVHRGRPWLLGALYMAVLAPLSMAPRISGNVSSRYMTIESIVERGTLAIDRSPWRASSGSPDVVRFGNHLYSDKPPVLAALATPLYGLLTLFHVRFALMGRSFLLANWVLVIGVVGVSSGLALVGLRQLLQAVPIRRWAADLLTLGFGFTSLLLTYGVTFNNHSVAAGLITWAVALTLLEPSEGDVWFRRGLVGFLLALAATIDLPAGGVWLAATGFLLLYRTRSVPGSFLLGAIQPLILHSVLQARITGSPLPAEMYPEAFDFPGSYWTTAGKWVETGPRWQFGLELILGPQGWLTVTPVLAFGAIGLVLALYRKGDPWRPLALAVVATTGILLVYYTWVVRRTDFAGDSFGTRHLLAITPVVYLFAVLGLVRLRGWLAGMIFVLLMLVGGVFAFEGARDPWSRIETLSTKRPALRFLQRGALYPWSSYRR